jgi:hypothetical protein
VSKACRRTGGADRDLGAKIKRLPDGATSPALEQAEVALRGAIANLRSVRNAITREQQAVPAKEAVTREATPCTIAARPEVGAQKLIPATPSRRTSAGV